MSTVLCVLALTALPFGGEDDALAPGVAAALDSALAPGSAVTAGQLYDTCVLAHGDVELLLEELEAVADSDDVEDARRHAALRYQAELLQRRGDLRKALRAYRKLSGDVDDPEVLLEEAHLLDALGRTEDALEAYEELLEEVEGSPLETHVHLRMALLTMEQDSDAKDALALYAGADGRDPDLRNRAAVVLALLGRPEDAIELFQVQGEGTKLFRQEVRVAEWAIRAGDAPKAQEHAWRAVASATLRRDRRYALMVLVEAHRLDESLGTLIDRFAAEPDLDDAARTLWIDLLRETERYEEAIAMFRDDRAGDELDIETRRELLEMYRESEQEETMVEVYRELIASEPAEIEWREGLARFLLERGDRGAAEEVWRPFVDGDGLGAPLIWGASALMELGLDELAIACAEGCVRTGQDPLAALLFLFGLHRDRGRMDDAVAALERMAEVAPADAPERLQLSEAWEQVGRQERAVETLEGVRDARDPSEVGEDLEMRLAWLYSEVDDEDRAMALWHDLWTRIDSIPRRRYVEDRLMTVAARLGKLADVAIELEDRLAAGTADSRDSGLLVRLYTKVGDPVSAGEVIEEFLKISGGSEVDALQEKARVYLSCTDYHSYEKTVRELIRVDPDGEPDYLRQLAMSQLERGKPDEARDVLLQLEALEEGGDSAEFEAGVLALAGMRDEAIEAYRRGIAEHPNRIESYLLLANLMQDTGEGSRAIGMFQHLAETAEKDDLFTIAIDGLLNLEAPPSVMNWARRITLERLARRHDKMYLYQLLADLAEQVEDREAMLTALESALPITGERRPSILRELMDMAKGMGDSFMGRGWEGDPEKHLAYGRRLIGLDELVPPQVYLDLGEAFLDNDEPSSAAKTFRLASDLPDYPVFQRQAAGLFESAGFRDEALRTYEKVLVSQSTDVSLMAKVGELYEQEGRDDVARGMYERAIDLLLLRRPLSTVQAAEEDDDDPFSWFRARNVDDYDQHYDRVLEGMLVATPGAEAAAEVLAAQADSVRADAAAVVADLGEGEELAELARYPRILRRAEFHRRLAVAFGRPEIADALDLELLATFRSDEGLLESLCQTRARWGLIASARGLIEDSARSEEEKRKVRFLVGEGAAEDAARGVPLDEARRLLLPLLVSNQVEDAKLLLRRTQFGEVEKADVQEMGALLSAAQYLEDEDLVLRIGQQWSRLLIKHNLPSFQVQPILEKCAASLEPERRRSLCEYVVSLVLEDPTKATGFLTLLPELQKMFEEPLVTVDDVMALIEEQGADGGFGWGLGPVLRMLPEEDRGAAVRTVWPDIQKTRRATFVLNLVNAFEEPMGEDLADFVVGAFAEALEDADEIFPYYVNDMEDADKNADTVVRLCDVMLEKEPEDVIARSIRAKMRLEKEELEDARADAVRVYKTLVDDDGGEWERNQAKRRVLDAFLPDHLGTFLGALDELEAERGDDETLVFKRLDLIGQTDDPDALLAAIEAALDERPEDVELLQRLRTWHRRNQRPWEALGVLERIVELTEDEDRKKTLGEELVAAWNGLRNPVKALEVRDSLGLVEEEEDDGGFDPTAFGLPAGLVLPAGAVITVSGPGGVTTMVGGDSNDDQPTIQKVKDALDEDDVETAKTTFRRLWRNFPKGENTDPFASVIYFSSRVSGGGGLTWPADEEEDDEGTDEPEEEPERPRGGIAEFSEEEPEEAEEARSAYEVLAEHPFGVEEMEKLLRSKTARELDGQQAVVEGLLHGRIHQSGAEGALDELLGTVRAGRAGKVEYAILLALLDANPDRSSADTEAILRDLVQTLSPSDAAGLRRLARVWARQGATDEATRLYRWCATQTSDTGYFFDLQASLSPHQLVKEVKETLDGDDRIEVIEAILTLAAPGDERWMWRRQSFEQLALDTWEELAGAEVALERCREICEEAMDPAEGLRRDTAKRAAYLFAHQGELDSAIRSLEFALCELDPGLFTAENRWYINPEYPGYLGHQDLRRLFPVDMEGWVDAAGWLRRATSAIEGWLAEDRVSKSAAVDALAVAARRMHQQGDAEGARRVLEGLAARGDLAPRKLLWVVDVAREAGADALADGIERNLFDERRLHVERVPEVVARALEQEGPEVALALGERATEASLHPDLLTTLVEAAAAIGDAEAEARWKETAARAEEAIATLEAEDEEEEAGEASESAAVGR